MHHRPRGVHRALAITASLALVVPLAACSGGDDTITLEFWDDSAGAATTPVYEELFAAFEEANPGIEVEYLGLPPGESAQRYNAAIANDATPDIGSVTSSRLAAILAQEAFLQLDDRFAGSELEGRLQEGLLEGIRDVSADDGLYALPFRGNLELMWYRPSLFESAGVEVPQTWDEFFAAAETLTDPATGQYGFTIRGGSGAFFQVMTEAFAASGQSSFFDPDGDVALRNDAAVDHIQRMADVYGVSTPESDLTNGYSEMVAQFTAGNVAMMHHDLFSAATLAEAFGDDLGAFALPRADTDDVPTQLVSGVPAYGVFAASEHPEEAWQLLEFLLSHDSNSALVEAFGSIPANTDAAQDEWAQSQPGIAVATAVLEDPATTTLFAPMYLPDYSSIETSTSEPLYQQVLLGDLSAEQFVDQVGTAFETSQQDYQSRHSG